MRRKKTTYKPISYQPVDHEKFYETRRMACLTREEAACLLHVTERTVRLWESGKSSIPYAAYKLLRLLTGGELPGKAWEGWTIRGDSLWSPTGRRFDAASLSYLELTFSMARNWKEDYDRKAAQRVRAALQEKLRLAKPVLYLVK
ncbi:MAG: VC1465 family Xer recombination activation factor [Methylophilaceae bacterium]